MLSCKQQAVPLKALVVLDQAIPVDNEQHCTLYCPALIVFASLLQLCELMQVFDGSVRHHTDGLLPSADGEQGCAGVGLTVIQVYTILQGQHNKTDDTSTGVAASIIRKGVITSATVLIATAANAKACDVGSKFAGNRLPSRPAAWQPVAEYQT